MLANFFLCYEHRWQQVLNLAQDWLFCSDLIQWLLRGKCVHLPIEIVFIIQLVQLVQLSLKISDLLAHIIFWIAFWKQQCLTFWFLAQIFRLNVWQNRRTTWPLRFRDWCSVSVRKYASSVNFTLQRSLKLLRKQSKVLIGDKASLVFVDNEASLVIVSLSHLCCIFLSWRFLSTRNKRINCLK